MNIQPVHLPTLGYFKNGNGYLGSAGPLRFQLENHTPKKESERVEGQIYDLTAVMWQGPFSRPYAQEIGQETFQVDEPGLAALADFLTQRARELDQAPVFTPQEINAYYLSKKQEEQTPQDQD